MTLRAYMSQPVVAAAVALAAFGPRVEPASDSAVARTIDPQWQTLLLRFAFTHELWNSWPKDEWNKSRRMDLARKLTAQEAIDQARKRRESMLRQAESSPERICERPVLAYLAGSPVSPDRMPTHDDLRVHAGEQTRNEYSDEQLVLAGVDLLLSPPFAPYGIDVPATRMTEALAFLLQRIRRDASRACRARTSPRQWRPRSRTPSRHCRTTTSRGRPSWSGPASSSSRRPASDWSPQHLLAWRVPRRSRRRWRPSVPVAWQVESRPWPPSPGPRWR